MTTTPPPAPANELTAAQQSAAHEATYSPIARRVRRWLGLDRQRRDFDKLGELLAMRDSEAAQMHAGARRDLEAQGKLLGDAVGQLNRNSFGLSDVSKRLTHYERTVPAIAGARKALDAAVKRQKQREKEQREEREKLIAEHPELTDAGKAHVMATGELPPSSRDPDAGTAGVGAVILPPSPTPLELMREAEGAEPPEADSA